MFRYTKMNPKDFQHMTWDAGIIVDEKDFDPSTGTISPAKIRWATTGDNSFSATRDITDNGEDINNCPGGAMQLQQAQPWQAQITGTAVTVTAKDICELLSADIDSEDETHIIPRNNITADDFKGKWIIANYSDMNGEKNGGYMAILLKNTLSSDGFSVNLKKNGKGQFPYTLKTYYDLNNIDEVPFEIYLKSGEAEPEPEQKTAVTYERSTEE